jgi:MYXO-CTERM domain-containing protein
MKLSKYFFALCISITASLANAGFVDTDRYTTGDKRAFLHEETGLEWLNLDETVGKSIDTVSSLLNSTYDGWRFATDDEVELLVQSAFAPYSFNSGVTSISGTNDVVLHAYTSSWINLVSKTGAASNLWDYGNGFYTKNNGTVVTVEVISRVTHSLDRVTEDATGGFTTSTSYRNTGVFLVSDGGTTLSSQLDPSLNINNPNSPASSNVSSPALLGLLGFGALVFGARRRTNR